MPVRGKRNRKLGLSGSFGHCRPKHSNVLNCIEPKIMAKKMEILRMRFYCQDFPRWAY
jgi:hypothetical protein